MSEASIAARQKVAPDTRIEGIFAFRKACASGNLSTAKMFAEYLSLTAFEVHLERNYALRAATDGRHSEVADWLRQTYYC
jgi:hypothetical protein